MKFPIKEDEYSHQKLISQLGPNHLISCQELPSLPLPCSQICPLGDSAELGACAVALYSSVSAAGDSGGDAAGDCDGDPAGDPEGDFSGDSDSGASAGASVGDFAGADAGAAAPPTVALMFTG